MITNLVGHEFWTFHLAHAATVGLAVWVFKELLHDAAWADARNTHAMTDAGNSNIYEFGSDLAASCA